MVGANGQEIKFGDNDTLSAISSSIVHADFLFLLTDVECLYTDNPRSNPDAKPVRVVRDIEKVKRQGMSLPTKGVYILTDSIHRNARDIPWDRWNVDKVDRCGISNSRRGHYGNHAL
jgi:uridylate kinase